MDNVPISVHFDVLMLFCGFDKIFFDGSRNKKQHIVELDGIKI